jgi:hypothetical protein
MRSFMRRAWRDLLASAVAALLAFAVASFVWIYNHLNPISDHGTGVSFTLWPVVCLAIVVFAVTWFIASRS